MKMMAEEKKSREKQAALEAALGAIERQFGTGSVMKLSEKKRMDVAAVPTGSLGLDLALGVGGVPRGRIVEIYGPEASGKTTLALSIIAEAQKKGGICALIDAEHAFDPDYAEKIGVNLEELLISQPDTGEQALEIADTLIRSNALDVVAIDSVAALVPRVELEGEMGDAVIGVQARLMSQAMRKMTSALARSPTVAIFVNQLRMKIGVMFGNPETTPGGLALKFYASVRLDLRRAEQLKSGDEVIGNKVRAKVVKNKVAPPFKTAEFEILYDEGISKVGELIDLGLKLGLVEKAGSWLVVKKEVAGEETQLGQGKESARGYLRSEPKLQKNLAEAITNAFQREKTSKRTK